MQIIRQALVFVSYSVNQSITINQARLYNTWTCVLLRAGYPIIDGYIGNTSLWIGLSAEAGSDCNYPQYKWSDGSSYKYSNWWNGTINTNCLTTAPVLGPFACVRAMIDSTQWKAEVSCSTAVGVHALCQRSTLPDTSPQPLMGQEVVYGAVCEPEDRFFGFHSLS